MQMMPWVGAAAIITVIFGSMFVVVQQAQRSDADYPQLQLAQDASTSLNKGTKSIALTQNKVEMTKSLAPFINIYDSKGKIEAGSGLLDGVLPEMPVGALKAADNKYFHRFTWQPKPGVRIAAVVVSGENRYILSGRSISMVEQNETTTLYVTAAGEVISLLLLAGICCMVQRLKRVGDRGGVNSGSIIQAPMLASKPTTATKSTNLGINTRQKSPATIPTHPMPNPTKKQNRRRFIS